MESILPILLWGGLFVVMMRFGCGAHMFGHSRAKEEKQGEGQAASGGGCCGAGDHASGDHVQAPKSRSNDEIRWVAPERDVDPVCGQTLSTDRAKPSLHDGQVYYFCSPHCREMFEASPEDFLGEDKPGMPLELEHRSTGGGGHA